MRFMVRSRGRDLNGWGVIVTVDVQDISLGNNSGAPFRNRSPPSPSEAGTHLVRLLPLLSL
jgi:hypothetical protein